MTFGSPEALYRLCLAAVRRLLVVEASLGAEG